MDFPEIVEYFKALRTSHQKFPVPVPYPPHLILMDGETTVGQVATPFPTSQTIAAMFSAIAVLHADLAYFSMETTVRSVETEVTTVPIGQDPNAKPGMLTVAAQTNASDVSVDAFSVDDEGQIEWQSGTWWSPLPPVLIRAMHECFDTTVPNSVSDFVVWMQLNHYAIKVHPSLYNPEDDG